MQTIKVYDEDARKLLAILTYDKFKGKKVEDIIKWLFEQDEVCEIVHKTIVQPKKSELPEWVKVAKCFECFKTPEYKYGATDCTKCGFRSGGN